MVEEILEPVMFDPEPGVTYVVNERTVMGGVVVKQRMNEARAPLSVYLLRRLASGRNP